MGPEQLCLCELRRQRNLAIYSVKEGGVQRVSFSDGWTSLVGVSLETLEDFLKFVHSEDRDNFSFYWHRSASNKSPQQFDFRVRNHAGEYRWLLANLMPICDDCDGASATMFIDITARKEGELGSLERFMAHWQPNPKGMCHFLGRAVARLAYRNLPDLFFAISTAYFAFREICERIDYIYANYQKEIGGECGKLLKELVEIEEQMNVVCLKDIGGNHCGIRVMLIRDVVDGYSTYSLRYFVKGKERLEGYLKKCWANEDARPVFERILQPLPRLSIPDTSQSYEDDSNFWNFRLPVEVTEGVIVYPDAQGFDDLTESKSLADFIVLVSNLLGYGKRTNDNHPIMP